MDQWDFLEETDYYLVDYNKFDTKWDDTLNWIVMLPEVGEKL